MLLNVFQKLTSFFLSLTHPNSIDKSLINFSLSTNLIASRIFFLSFSYFAKIINIKRRSLDWTRNWHENCTTFMLLEIRSDKKWSNGAGKLQNNYSARLCLRATRQLRKSPLQIYTLLWSSQIFRSSRLHTKCRDLSRAALEPS